MMGGLVNETDLSHIEDPWERGKEKARDVIRQAVVDIDEEIKEHLHRPPFAIAADGHPHKFHLEAATDQKRRMKEALDADEG